MYEISLLFEMYNLIVSFFSAIVTFFFQFLFCQSRECSRDVFIRRIRDNVSRDMHNVFVDQFRASFLISSWDVCAVARENSLSLESLERNMSRGESSDAGK